MECARPSPLFGAMFHHFHGGAHAKGQGSVDAERFDQMLDYLTSVYDVLSPEAFREHVAAGTLEPEHVCLTFDDALKCQADIAAPVLRRRGLRAFFFVYSGAFGDSPDYLEFYRDFRHRCFDSVDAFYAAFFEAMDRQAQVTLEQTYPPDYLSAYPFYTDNDRRFRYARDQVLGPDGYESLMLRMMDQWDYDRAQWASVLFMSADDLRGLERDGHTLGLHSDSHPTRLDDLSADDQRAEYRRNLAFLQSVVDQPIWSMSHPCGRYSATTLSALEDLGITLGFRSSLTPLEVVSPLEVPREDHANILRAMS